MTTISAIAIARLFLLKTSPAGKSSVLANNNMRRRFLLQFKARVFLTDFASSPRFYGLAMISALRHLNSCQPLVSDVGQPKAAVKYGRTDDRAPGRSDDCAAIIS
jgi:hypothetical protein